MNKFPSDVHEYLGWYVYRLIDRGCPVFLLNIEKRSLPRLMLSGDGLASKDAM